MRFNKLTIENYKSFQFKTEINFPRSSDGRSIYLIGGMNGSGKTAITEAINYCLYGAKPDIIYKNVNRKEKAKGNLSVSFALEIELDDQAELIVKRSWNAGVIDNPKPRDMLEQLIVIRDNKRVSIHNKQMWQDFIRATIPPGITQFFFFDGEKIQEIAADEHSEVRLKSSLEAALGIQYITRLNDDILYLKQEAKKDHIEISDEDLNFKESELKKEKKKLLLKQQEQEDTNNELEIFKEQYKDAKKKFQATFNAEPETREVQRQSEKKRIQASNKLGQIENEIKTLCEKYLPFSIVGKLFEELKQQIEIERESAQTEAIRENAAELAKKIVRVVEEPEPIYKEKLSPEKMKELEQRIYRLLKEGASITEEVKILNLSDHDAARVLHKVETIEESDVFLIKPLLEEKREIEAQIKELDSTLYFGAVSSSEKELFEELNEEIESCLTQIGRKKEQIRIQDEEIIAIDKQIKDIEIDIERLYEKYNVSQRKSRFYTRM